MYSILFETTTKPFPCSFHRPEIFLAMIDSKQKPSEDLEWVLKRLKTKQTSCEKILIFFSSVQTCQRVYNEMVASLGEHAYDGTALLLEMYHAHHKPETKDRILQTFTDERSTIRVLFSTIAFGMGVQIPDIDLVVHYGLADSVLTFWQETGRCARSQGRHGTSVTYAFKVSVARCKDDTMKKAADRKQCIREVVMETFAVHGHQQAQFHALITRRPCDGNCHDAPCECLRCSCCTVCNSRCQCPKMQPKDGILR